MNTTMLWGAGIVLALVVGWLLRGLMDRPRQAAERAVAQERMARLEAELTAARSAAEAQAHAPEQVAQVMAPVQTALSRLEEAVARAEGGRASSTAQLAEQMRAVAQATSVSTDGLRRETARLVGALGHSEVRGRWGEFQLRRLLESSGLVRDVHFTEQQSVSTDSGILRPGCRAPPRRAQVGRGGREGLAARDPRHRGGRPAGRGGRGTCPARTGGAKPRRPAGEQGVRPAVRHRAGVRGHVPACRVAARRSPGLRPRPARARLRSQRRPGDADHPDGPDPHSRAHLAPGRVGRQRPGGPGPGSRAGRAAWPRCSGTWTSWGRRWARA